MARPKKKKSDKYVPLSVWVQPMQKSKVQKKAKLLKMKESGIIRNLIDSMA